MKVGKFRFFVKWISFIFIVFFAACSSNSGGATQPVGESSQLSQTVEVLSSPLEAPLSSAGDPNSEASVSNGSFSNGMASSSYLSSGGVLNSSASSAAILDDSEIIYKVINMTTNLEGREYIATEEVKFIGDQSLAKGDVPLPANISYVDLNANGEYDRVSFIETRMNGKTDTVTLALNGECTLNGLCYIGSSRFVCYAYNDCSACENANTYHTPRVTEKTLFVNYGPNKLTDAAPIYSVPPIDSMALREAFAQLNYKTEDFLSPQIHSNYTLKAKGLPEGMEFRSSPDIPRSSSSGISAYSSAFVLYIMNACNEFSDRYPNKYFSERTESLYNASTTELKGDTTITWTLIYTNQFDISDSLSIAPFVRKT